jgi:hypothetical protein
MSLHQFPKANTPIYGRDQLERWVLFLDALHQRADNMIEPERQGMPLHEGHTIFCLTP